MNWFAYDTSHGRKVPMLFDERPAPSLNSSEYQRLIPDSIKEIPEHLRDASIREVEDCLNYNFEDNLENGW